MKKILLFVLSILVLSVGSALPIQQMVSDDYTARLRNMLPDSVLHEIENDTFILFEQGQLWSLIIKRGSLFVALNGQDKWVHTKILSYDEDVFDTVGLFEANKELIKWGFDSLANLSLHMSPIYRTDYSPFYRYLRIYNTDKHQIFNSDDAISFAGPDSTGFNSKLNKLQSLMHWLSTPFIRPYTSDSLFCSQILLDRMRQIRKATYAGTFQRNFIDNNYDSACADCDNTLRRLECLSLNAFIAWAMKEYNVREMSFVIRGIENQPPIVYKAKVDSLFLPFEFSSESDSPNISQMLKSGHTIAGVSSRLNDKVIEIALEAIIPDSTAERESSFNQISCLYTYRLGVIAEKEDSENNAVKQLLEEITEDNESFITGGFLSDEILNEFEWRIYSVKVDIKPKKAASELDKITFDNFFNSPTN